MDRDPRPRARAGPDMKPRPRARGRTPAAPDPAHPVSRKPRRTSQERAAIVRRVLTGMCNGKSVREMAKVLHVPRSRLMEWLLSATYRDQYARAREEQGRALAEEALDLARAAKPEDAHAVRVAVDTLKWAAGRMAPRDYGDRLEVGGQVGHEHRFVVEVPHLAPSPDVWAARYSQLLGPGPASPEAETDGGAP